MTIFLLSGMRRLPPPLIRSGGCGHLPAPLAVSAPASTATVYHNNCTATRTTTTALLHVLLQLHCYTYYYNCTATRTTTTALLTYYYNCTATRTTTTALLHVQLQLHCYTYYYICTATRTHTTKRSKVTVPMIEES